MADQVNYEVAEIGVRLLDDAYLAWAAAENECSWALREWSTTAGARRAELYRAYMAALDREEAAANDLRRLWELSEPCRDALTTARQHSG
jgi:hypothetical protein